MNAPALLLLALLCSAWRVRIGLALKGLAYEYRAVNLLAREQDQRRPPGPQPRSARCPVLEVEEDGRRSTSSQSMAILE